MDYYAVLGIARTATARDVKNAYWQLMQEYHPDHVNSSDKLKGLDPTVAKTKFEEIQKAWNYFEQHIDFSKMSDSTDPIEELIKQNSLYPFETPWGPNRVCNKCKAVIKESIAKYADRCPSCGRTDSYRNNLFRPDYGNDKGLLTLAAFTLKYKEKCVKSCGEDSYIGKFEKWDRSGHNYSGGTTHCSINFGGALVVIGTTYPGRVNYANITANSTSMGRVESDGTMDHPIEQILSIVDPRECIPLRKEKIRKRLEETRALLHFDVHTNREELIQDVINSIPSPEYRSGYISKKVDNELLGMAKSMQAMTSFTLPSTLQGSVQEFTEFIYDLTTVGAVTWDDSESFTGSGSAVATADAENFRLIFSRIPAMQLIVTLSNNFRLTVHKKKKDKLVGVPIVDINSKLLSKLADEIKKQQTRT